MSCVPMLICGLLTRLTRDYLYPADERATRIAREDFDPADADPNCLSRVLTAVDVVSDLANDDADQSFGFEGRGASC
jgi:hypothetical protein